MVFGRTASKIDPSQRKEIRNQVKKYGTQKAGLDQQIAKDQAEDNAIAQQDPQQGVLNDLDMATAISERLKQGQSQSRQQGRAEAQEFLRQPQQGLTPEQRQNLQEQANRQLNRDLQGYQRKLVGKQGVSGIKGGAAYAQQADLARMALDAQQEFQRDLSNLDIDQALKKAALIFGVGENYLGEDVLRNQQALDLLSGFENKRHNRSLENKFNRYFERI